MLTTQPLLFQIETRRMFPKPILKWAKENHHQTVPILWDGLAFYQNA